MALAAAPVLANGTHKGDTKGISTVMANQGNIMADTDIIITEIMIDPQDVRDNRGEWFELYNRGTDPVVLEGWILRDTLTDYHVIDTDGLLTIGGLSSLVFCVQTDQTINGDFACDYQYEGIVFDNNIDQLILQNQTGTTIDQVEYETGVTFPYIAGTSMYYVGGLTGDNNVGTNWLSSTERQPGYQNDDCALCNDFGSPGLVDPLLPVDLVDFEAIVDGTSAVLTWGTRSESNNAGFEVQKKEQDGEYEVMGWVQGAGTSAEAQEYRFTVTDLIPGSHAFRLKQVDFDGVFEYSDEISLTVAAEAGYFVGPPYPNPFNPSTTLSVSVSTEQRVVVEVFDILGRNVMTVFDGRMNAGQTQELRIVASSLPSGTYLVQVNGRTFSETRSLYLMK